MNLLCKIKHLLQRFVICCREYPNDKREFGHKVARVKFWDVLIPTGKSKKYIETLSAYMSCALSPLTEQYCQGKWVQHNQKRTLDKTPIWVCWWQGEENMPPIVKACVNRMRECLPENTQLHIITVQNMPQYINLPVHILEKHKKGQITHAHLSDVLRFGLLGEYGGLWLDSTIYLSKPLPEKIFTEKFYTQKFENWECCPCEACRGKWCGFYLAGKADNVLFRYMYDALCSWWKNHSRVIDYVFFDYILWAGYCGVPAIQQCIDAVEPNNPNIWQMQKHLNNPFVQEEYEKLLASNDFFKLSYKGNLTVQTEDGKKTVYGHILSEKSKR